MADDGNKIGQLHVDVVADTTKLDATLKDVKSKAESPKMGETSDGALGLGNAVHFAKRALERMFLPILAATTIFRSLMSLEKYIKNVGDEARKTTEAIEAIADGINKTIITRSKTNAAAKEDDATAGRASATDRLAIEDELTKDLRSIEIEREKSATDLKTRSLASQGKNLIENALFGTPLIADQLEKVTESSGKAMGAAMEKRNAALDALDIKERKYIKDAQEAAKQADREVRLASVDGKDRVAEETRQKLEDISDIEAKTQNEQELNALAARKESVRQLAMLKLAAIDEEERKETARINAEKYEAQQAFKEEQRQKEQILKDFNAEARKNLNDLLNTSGIEVGLDGIKNILLAIKSSQGQV